MITVYQADTFTALPKTHRDALQQWLKDHDIEPTNLPMSEPITLDGDTIHYWAYDRDEATGRVKATRNDQGELRVIAEERTTELRTQPPYIKLPD